MPHVLIVDDDPAILEILRAYLTAEGHTVLEAADGGQARALLPRADLAILDPIVTTGFVTRNHAFLVFDTLYGWDEQYRAQPQMVAGHTVADDGLTWTMTLREGLRFHDGEPVRARDAVVRRGEPLLRLEHFARGPGVLTVRLVVEIAPGNGREMHDRGQAEEE